MKGKRLSLDGLSLFYAGNDKAHFRVGISVSKKLANAVKRNLLKRRIRNCIMTTLKGHSLGYDLVFVARRELYQASFPQIMKAVDAVLKRTVIRTKKPEGARS
jgi:ribonuclease P protein component